MQRNLPKSTEQFTKRNHRRRIWKKVVGGLACIVVFCTTYALILPAITKETSPVCTIEEHEHGEKCYTQISESANAVMLCTPESLGVHVHSEGCTDANGSNICGKADYVLHIHNSLCNDENGNLICTLPEVYQHVHSDSCYSVTETQPAEVVHAHSEDCYERQQGDLTCQLVEDGHTHGDSCYSVGTTLLCTEMENHIHDEGCYIQKQGTLECQLSEAEHTHTDSCYATELELTCQEAEGHLHENACYDQMLVCEIPETEGHEHDDSCYAWNEVLNCTDAAADQSDAAATEPAEPELVCTIAERKVHTHGDSCYIGGALSCGLLEVTAHEHSDACVQTAAEQTVACTLKEGEDHTHTAICYGTWELTCGYEAHTHELICYADPTADVETAEDWEKTFAGAELTGLWTEDVLAIARTQLGYVESTRNYIVLEDGETIKGYSRYGAWYGDPYGDWCAMFVSFCLDYAGVEDMPLDANCQNWINALTEAGLYTAAAEAEPQPGDIVFFDYECNGISDHVGIVETVTAEEITTIEGNSVNRVQRVTYARGSAAICGYGHLPYQLSDVEQEAVDRVIAMIDAIPSADEIDAKIAQFEAAEDYDGEEAWYTEVTQQVAQAYYYYDQLPEGLKPYVTNADKLLDLEYIWSVTTYSSVITSATPTPTWYTSTKDFIELNLYDYIYGINDKWESNKNYPGFQWNGGAYSNQNDGYLNDYRYYYSSEGIGIPYAITDRYYIDSIDFGNSLITNHTYGGDDYEKSTTAIDVGKASYYYSSTGPINWLYGNSTEGYTNKPVGTSTTDNTQSEKVMYRTLVDGYPALSDGTSLAYLFGGTSESYVIKQNTQWIDGLFQQDSVTGEYRYNSRTNHAQYSNNFFTLYEEIITPNFITYPFGNFLPLNTISDTSQATQIGAFNYDGGMEDYVDGIIADLDADLAYDEGNDGEADYQDTSRKQLKTMLQEYQENWDVYDYNNFSSSVNWSTLSPAMAIKDYFAGAASGGNSPSANVSFITQEHLDQMYNIDWDVATNFFFGMEMKMEFMQPKDGYTGNDTNGDGESDYPMVFEFTGDDDVWVYIDDVLFLDLTGIHRHVGGKIDFVNGKVYYYELLPSTTGDISESEYAWYSFAALFRAAGWTEDQIDAVLEEADTAGNRPFKDYTTHSFNFYYMERGSGSSVCRMNFNFPLLKENSISVTKENTEINNAENEAVMGNPDYYFNIVNTSNQLFVGPGSVTGVTTYKIMDSAGNILKNADGTDKVFTVDQYGIFTLKAGQTAVFEGIEENEGKFFVQELIKEEDNGQYPTVKINDTNTRYNDLIDWSYRKYFYPDERTEPVYVGPYGYKWYGRSGYDTDSSANSSFYFEQQNHVDISKLGKLSISKVLEGTDMDKTFDMEITLDGVKLPVGTKYILDGVEKEVATEGIITLAPGQVAVIPNIISGTKFTVRETNGGDYTVSYTASGYLETDEDEFTTNGSISGVVRTDSTVAVTVTNAEQGTSVEIPVTKRFSANGLADASHSYTFTLEQVTDSTGSTLVESGTTLAQNAEFTGNSDSFDFVLTYYKHKLETIPQTFYYKITETTVDSDALANSQVFVAEVKVEDNGSGGIKASLVAMHNSATTSADFVNTLAGSLTLEKIVDGGTEAQTNGSFSFTITPALGSSGLDALPTSYPATFCQQDKTVENTTVYLDGNGQIKLSGFKHGEKAVIYGLPIGTTWTIEEAAAEGFTVKTEVSVNDGAPIAGTGTVTTGSVTSGMTEVRYTNQQTYVLPETGGAGTTSYTMAGLMLMLCSAAYLLYRFKKRRREAV